MTPLVRIAFGITVALSAMTTLVRAADTPKTRQLPAGTTICTAERDIVMFMTTSKRGLTCIQTSSPSSFTVLSRTSAAYEEVKLTAGDHAGVTGWTPILVVTRKPSP